MHLFSRERLAVVLSLILAGCASSSENKSDSGTTGGDSTANAETTTTSTAATSTATASTASSNASTTASASATADASKIEEFSIDPADLEVDAAKKIVRFNKDGRRQTNVYRHYEFDRDAFIKVVGTDKPKNPIKLKVEIRGEKIETKTPADKNAPQPKGGFEHRTYDCRAVELIP